MKGRPAQGTAYGCYLGEVGTAAWVCPDSFAPPTAAGRSPTSSLIRRGVRYGTMAPLDVCPRRVLAQYGGSSRGARVACGAADLRLSSLAQAAEELGTRVTTTYFLPEMVRTLPYPGAPPTRRRISVLASWAWPTTCAMSLQVVAWMAAWYCDPRHCSLRRAPVERFENQALVPEESAEVIAS